MGNRMGAWVGRRLGQLAAVALVALFLVGPTAVPAEATARDDGRKEANDFIAWCYASGGDPEVIEATADRIYVICYKGSDTVSCEFYPTHYCWDQEGPLSRVNDPFADIVPVERPALADPVEAGVPVLTEDGGATSEDGVQLAEGADTDGMPADPPPATEQPANEGGSFAEAAPANVAPAEGGDTALAGEVVVEPAVVEPVEAAVPAEGVVDAPADDPVDEQA